MGRSSVALVEPLAHAVGSPGSESYLSWKLLEPCYPIWVVLFQLCQPTLLSWDLIS